MSATRSAIPCPTHGYDFNQCNNTCRPPEHHRGDDQLGLPYASAVVDDRGYAVICPRCGQRCAAEGTVGEATVEDDVTKGAALAYALHWEQAERAEAHAIA